MMKLHAVQKPLVILCSLALSGACLADVTIEQKVMVEGSGSMSVMNSTGTVLTAVSGKRGRTENRMESDSRMMKAFAKNVNTATIVLLEDEKMLNLMPDEQEYSEVTFEQMRQQMEQGMAQMEEMQAGGGLPVSEEDCQWSEPVVEVQKTRNSEKFAGVKARQTLITARQSCTVPDTGKSCEMTWNLEYWNARKMPGRDEAMAFQEGMAKAMGGDELLALAKVNTRGVLGMFKGGWDEVLAESGDIDGYPVAFQRRHGGLDSYAVFTTTEILATQLLLDLVQLRPVEYPALGKSDLFQGIEQWLTFDILVASDLDPFGKG